MALAASLVLPGFGFEAATYQTETGKKVPVAANQVLVRIRPALSPAANAQALARFGVQPQSRINEIGVEVWPVPRGDTIESFVRRLKNDPDIEFAEPNAIAHAFFSPDDPDFLLGHQYYLNNNPATENGVINIQPAWDLTTGNPLVVVAVVDTGVLILHPDLNGKITPQQARMENILYPGDCNAPGNECASGDANDNNDPYYHGTHVAGVIAAATNNGLQIAGVAPECKIMPVKVLTAEGAGTFVAIANGIIFAVNNGAKVINMSLGGPFNSGTLTEAVKYALVHDVVVVAASGNCGGMIPCPCGSVMYPAAIDGVMAVGATNELDQIADFSCPGPQLHLTAPGVGILSLSNGVPTPLSGTSLASPMVAGVAGLIRSLDSTIPSRDVIRYIDFNADDLGPPRFDPQFGFGRLNAGHALQAAQARSKFVSNPGDPGESFPYPNPFNPTEGFSVTFSIPEDLGSEDIKIDVFNLLGERIKTLNGTNEWNGRNEDGNFIASGLYFYHLHTAKGSKKGKLTVIK